MEEQLLEFYGRVFTVVEYFVEEAIPVLTIDNVKQINPTVAEMAKTLRQLHAIIGLLANDSYEQEEMRINALQCVILMERIAQCVEHNDEDALPQLVGELEDLAKAPIPLNMRG